MDISHWIVTVCFKDQYARILLADSQYFPQHFPLIAHMVENILNKHIVEYLAAEWK